MATIKKGLHPADEFYNRGVDSLDHIVDRQPALAPFTDALQEFNKMGNYFQERPRQEMPSALPPDVSLSSAFNRLDAHIIPPLFPRTDEGPYQQSAASSSLPIWVQLTENRLFRYLAGITFGAGLLVMFALQVQMSNLKKTQAILRHAEHSQLEEKIQHPALEQKIRFAHQLTDRERAHTVPLVRSPFKNWPDEVGLEYDRLNNLHDQLEELNYKSVHDKYHPLEGYVISVCKQLSIPDTDLALALLGSGWVVNSLEYEDKGIIRQTIREKLGDFKKMGLSKFLKKEISGGEGPTADYDENAQTRYEKLFREYEALQGYHQELQNKKEQNENKPLDLRSINRPSLRFPKAGASRLEWPEEIPCQSPLYRQQHLQSIIIGNEFQVVNPGGKYLVTPSLSAAARKNIIALEMGISHAHDPDGYYALAGGTSSVVTIPPHFRPGTYNLGIAVRFKDGCEQFYESTLRVTNQVFDKAANQFSQEGITLKMPHVYD